MENASRQITAKFDLATQLFAALERADAGHAALRVELDAIRTRYALSTGHIFLRAAGGGSGRQAARDDFQRVVAAEGFVAELDYLVLRARAALGLAAAAAGAGAPGEPPATAQQIEGEPPAADGGEAGPKRRGRRPAGGRNGQDGGGAEKKAAAGLLLREARAVLDQYTGYEVDCAARAVEASVAGTSGGLGGRYNWCGECALEMTVNAETSELECPGCRRCRELIGTVFDDAQFYNQEGQKAKSGSFNPNRHFRFWMDRILAREPEEELGDRDDPDNTCGEKLLARLRAIVRRDKKILRLITVDDVRAMLKEAGRTDLNKNVPLIMKKLTGVAPPQLPESLCQRVEKLFSKAIGIGEQVRPAGRTNRNYYPYYIYKILDAVLPEGDADNRRVLRYIYMQGKDTLDKNDREWEDICAELPEIEWAPTDRAKALRYQPN